MHRSMILSIYKAKSWKWHRSLVFNSSIFQTLKGQVQVLSNNNSYLQGQVHVNNSNSVQSFILNTDSSNSDSDSPFHFMETDPPTSPNSKTVAMIFGA